MHNMGGFLSLSMTAVIRFYEVRNSLFKTQKTSHFIWSLQAQARDRWLCENGIWGTSSKMALGYILNPWRGPTTLFPLAYFWSSLSLSVLQLRISHKIINGDNHVVWCPSLRNHCSLLLGVPVPWKSLFNVFSPFFWLFQVGEVKGA